MIIDQQFWQHLFNEEFFIAVSFIIFVILLYKPVKKMLNNSLDERNHQIKNRIEEAKHLHKEAKILVNHYRDLNSKITDETTLIERSTMLEIQNMRDVAKRQIERVKQQKALHLQYSINQLEAQVSSELKNNMLMLAITTCKDKVRSNLAQNISMSNPEITIRDTILPELLH